MAYTETPVSVVSASFDINSAADKATLSMPFNKQRVRKVWVEIRGTDAGGATVAFDIRPTAGSDSGRGAGDAGIITVPASNQQGKRLYEQPSSAVILTAGQEIIAEVTAEGVTALQAVAGVELEYIPETEANVATMTAA